MEQGRLLLRLMAFTAFAGAMYLLFLAFVPQRPAYRAIRDLKVPLGGYGHTWSRFNEAERYGPVDVLFLGSSHAYRGLDTRIWEAHGIRAFNLGSSRQTPLQSELMLQRHLSSLRPRTVLLEVDPSTFASDGVESGLDVLANGPADTGAWRLAWRLGHLKTWNTLLYTWVRWGIWGRPRLDEARTKGMDTYIPGGFVEREVTHNRPRPPGKPEPMPPLPMQLRAFERMQDLVQQAGARLVLVEAPVTRAWRATYVEHDAFAERMRTAGPYLDMFGAVELDDSLHFYDAHHLNQHGVELFNRVLIRQLASEGLIDLPDKP